MDSTEVTTAAYNDCVRRGVCTRAHGQQKTCNGHRKDRDDHPINCVDWKQASTYCKTHGKRLPTEAEWEVAARGGLEGREYSWGSDAPDGRTCWKQPHSCPVGEYGAGAYGLHDMTGNVWEWTASWYGPHPWPPPEAHHRVYRGGSWSRRFEKWMKTTLRNRVASSEWGSHLGFRCAAPFPDAECPYGARDDGSCRHGVDAVECPSGEEFNGVRCARRGEPRCPPGHSERVGFGCTPDAGFVAAAASGAPTSSPADAEAEGQVTRSRSPGFDEDCRKYQPTRPVAYRFEGGTHLARNRVGKRLGCKNRDVGVGYNSACCP